MVARPVRELHLDKDRLLDALKGEGDGKALFLNQIERTLENEQETWRPLLDSGTPDAFFA